TMLARDSQKFIPLGAVSRNFKPNSRKLFLQLRERYDQVSNPFRFDEPACCPDHDRILIRTHADRFTRSANSRVDDMNSSSGNLACDRLGYGENGIGTTHADRIVVG